MKTVFTLLLSTVWFSLYSQTPPLPKDVKLADSLYYIGQFEKSIPFYQKTIDQYEKNQSFSSKVYIHAVTNKADALMSISLYKEAHDFVETKTKIVEAIDDPDQLRMAYFYSMKGEIARIYFSDYSAAKAFYKKALSFSIDSKDKSEKFYEDNLFLGILHSDIAEYDSAEYYFDMALKGFTKLYGSKHYRVGGVHGQIASNELKKGNYWNTLASAKEALTISIWEVDSTLIDSQKYIDADSLSNFYSDLFTLIEEEDILGKIHPVDAQIALIVMNSYDGLGDWDLAEKMAHHAIKVFNSTSQPLLTAACQITLASIYSYKNQHRYALTLYKQVRDIYSSQGIYNNENAAILYDNMASAFELLYEFDSAKYYTKKALRIAKNIFSTTHWRTGGFNFNLAVNFKKSGDLDSANLYLDKAYTTDFKPKGLIVLNKAIIHQEQKNFNLAYKNALWAYQNLPEDNKSHTIDALTTLGYVANDLGQLDSANLFFNKALELALGDYEFTGLNRISSLESLEDPQAIFLTVNAKADFLLEAFKKSYDEKYLPELLALANFGKKLIAHFRATFIMEGDNIQFSNYTNQFIGICMEAYINMYDITKNDDYLYEAFSLADINKSQVLLEAIKSSVTNQNKGNLLINKWSQLKKKIKSEETKIRNMEVSGLGTSSEKVLYEKQLTRLQNEYNELLVGLKKNHPGIFHYISEEIRTFPLKAFKQYLRKTKTTVSQFYLGHKNIYHFIMTNDGIDYVSIPNSDSIKNSAKAIIQFVSRSKIESDSSYTDYIRASRHLYQLLFEKVEGKVKNNNLIVIPHNYLTKVPFEVLLTKTPLDEKVDFKSLPYIIKNWNISYASSASVLYETIARDQIRDEEKLAAGWAPFSGRLPLSDAQEETLRGNDLRRLTGSSKELESLADKFSGQTFLNKEASEASFKSFTKNANILHIATHGIINDESPEESLLLFSKEKPDSVDDGYLHLYELYDMPLNNELTVLSSCSSGDGQLTVGEGVMSMARGFTYAGSKSVVMSLWLANDNSTSKIIQGFYSHLADQDSKSEALRKSKLEYLEAANNLSSHPFYWAHMISTGSNEPLVKSKNSMNTKFIVAISLVMLILIAIGLRKRAQIQ